MAITEEFIQTLLYEEESTTLDFKSTQYRFTKASDDEKSELLKDILAFCNAWRRADAYILIGVKEVKGGRSEIHGISELLDDAKLQQFVNQKTQKPVDFSYQDILVEGKQIAILHIPIQKRPLYLKKDFGKLKQHVVYIRRGSSTDQANPDEIARMGNDTILHEPVLPIIKLNFADTKEQKLLPEPMTQRLTVLNGPKPQDIPDYEDQTIPRGLYSINLNNDKYKGYYRKLVKYYEIMSKVKSINFAITNEGDTVAHDVKVRIDIPDPEQIFVVLDEYSIPDLPISNQFAEIAQTKYIPFNSSSSNERELRVYQLKKQHHVIEVAGGKVQPKDTIWIESELFVGAVKSCKLEMNVLIYADNLPEPTSLVLKMIYEVEHKDVSLKDILESKRERWIQEYINAN